MGHHFVQPAGIQPAMSERGTWCNSFPRITTRLMQRIHVLVGGRRRDPPAAGFGSHG